MLSSNVTVIQPLGFFLGVSQDAPGALPLMQFALRDLFDAQQARGGVIALTLSDYLARGGLHKALERHADAVFARLSESEQQLAQTIFSGLIASAQRSAKSNVSGTSAS